MIPPGFKFCPSDRMLLSYYLLKKLKGEPTNFGIPNVDVYGIEPWRLFRKQINFDDSDDDEDDEAIHSNNVMYVFTEIKKKHGSGKKVDRIVTSNNQVVGTWKGQTTQTKIRSRVSNKKIVGVKKMFSFTPVPPPKQDHDEDNDDDDDDEGRNGENRKRKINDQLDGISYIMHEYSMAGICYVLCRIRRKIDKKKKKKKKRKLNTSVVPYHNQISMRQQQPAVQSAAAVPGGLPDDDLQNMLMDNFC